MSVSNILGPDGKILSQYVSGGGGFTPEQFWLGDGLATATDETPVRVEIDGDTSIVTVPDAYYILQGSYAIATSVDNEVNIGLSIDLIGNLDPTDSNVLIVDTLGKAYNTLSAPLTNVGFNFCVVFKALLDQTSLLLYNEPGAVGETSLTLSGVIMTRIA